MNKLFLFAVFAVVLAVAMAQGGVKDIAGNYYDFTTGQVASSYDGKVYNTHRPLVYGAYGAYGYGLHHGLGLAYI